MRQHIPEAPGIQIEKSSSLGGGALHVVINLHSTGKKIAIVLIGIIALIGFQILADRTVEMVSSLIAARLVPIYKVDRPDKVISISFDAMWGTEYTDRILDILDKYNVKTTFFLGGYWVEKYPDYVKKLHERGHEIGNHTYSHPHLNSLSPEGIRRELERNEANIMAITGVKPILFRPPFGEYNNAVIETATKLGYYTIQWSIDSLDWKDLSADQIVNRVVSAAGPGDIVLLHNNGKHTAEAVDRFIPILQQRGFKIVPISELIYKDNYYIESHSGIQKPIRVLEDNSNTGQPSGSGR